MLMSAIIRIWTITYLAYTRPQVFHAQKSTRICITHTAIGMTQKKLLRRPMLTQCARVLCLIHTRKPHFKLLDILTVHFFYFISITNLDLYIPFTDKLYIFLIFTILINQPSNFSMQKPKSRGRCLLHLNG